MVFKSAGGRTFKLRLSVAGRKPRTVSTGMTDKGAANDVARTVQRMKGRGQLAPLLAVLNDRATLVGVYHADVTGTLEAFMAALDDTDIEPLVAEWAKRANAKYVTQVRALIPEGERFPASRFRRKEISSFLAGLDCSGPTKNRYRAALSVFAKWLVEREVLDANPVRDVAMQKEHDPRMVWMTWDDAQRVAEAAQPMYEHLFALMAGTGIELGAALRLTRADVDLSAQTIHARGSKTAWRNRVVRYEDWTHGYLYRLTSRCVGSTPLFPGITLKMAWTAFQHAQKAVGLSGHRIHDLRHTYAVNALKKGYRPQVVAHQLGHKDASMVIKVYGRFIPDAADYVVTNSVTTPSRKARGKRA